MLTSIIRTNWDFSAETGEHFIKNMNPASHFVTSSFKILVQHFVISCILTLLVPSCDVLYNFHIKTIFGSSLPQIVYCSIKLFSPDKLDMTFCSVMISYLTKFVSWLRDIPYSFSPQIISILWESIKNKFTLFSNQYICP